MRRRRLLIAALLAISIGGTLPAAGKGECSTAGYDDKCEGRALWVTTRMSAIWSSQYSHSTKTVVVGGTDYEKDGTETIAASGFDARTGRRRWRFVYDDPVHLRGIGKDVVLSRDGRVAFVAGLSRAEDTHYDWVTFAVRARTGELLWKKRFGGRGPDVPWQVLADPRRDAVYVAGETTKKSGGQAIVAYDASTGQRLWRRERGSEGRSYGIGRMRLRGRDLYVLESVNCYSEGCEGGEMLTRATPTRSGFGRIWSRRLPQTERRIDYLFGPVEAGPTRAFVVGTRDVEGGTEFVVQALRRRSGALAWTAVLEVDGADPVTFPVAAFDEFRRQLVVGDSNSYSRPRIASYAESDGEPLWVTRFTRDDPHEAALGDIGASRRAVYATGTVYDVTHRQAVTTVALAPRSGRQRWIARYQPPDAETVFGYLRFRAGRLVIPLDGFPTRGRSMWTGLVVYRLGE